MTPGFSLLAQQEDGRQGGQHGQDEDDRQGAGVGQVAVDEDALGDLVADHLAAGAADQVGHDVGAQGRDEHDQDGRHQAAAGCRAGRRAGRPGADRAPRSRAASTSRKSNFSAAA